MKLAFPCIAAFALAACAATPIGPPLPLVSPANDGIYYDYGSCYSLCTIYTLGMGTLTGATFSGRRRPAVVGERTLVAPYAYERVAAGLQRWRPEGNVRYSAGGTNCPNAKTSQSHVKVAWARADGSVSGELDFDFACSDANPELAMALRAVPSLLGAEALIDTR